MTKKIKKGVKGQASQYITRSKAIKKLQLSLQDFRRLCILKGVYPREPSKKLQGRTKTYYHVKDVNYLAHDKILDKFREIKTALKKAKKYKHKDQIEKSKKIRQNLPKYNLQHLIKERYPTFADALRDLDDPLCLVNLFSSLQAHKLFKIPNQRIQISRRLAQEFNFYVIKSRSLRKVFLSIKGIYYQAEIQGQTVTWIQPYQFSQKLPPEVDFKVMLTFLEFYETLLKFTNYKLYAALGLKYPPKINDNLQQELDSFSYSVMVTENREETTENQIQDEKYKISNEFEEDETVKQMKDKFVNEKGDLFEGMVFYCSREVPRYSLEFVILAFGGQVLWDSNEKSNHDNESITHVITDRDPKFIKMQKNREYIQPQWIYDCINNKVQLPIADYAPGKILPPHLSPFVDAEEEGGYKPARQIELDKLRGQIEGALENGNEDDNEEIIDEDDEDDDDEEEKDEADSLDDDDDEEEDVYDHEKELKKQIQQEKAQEKEMKKLSEVALTKKKKKVYDMLVNQKNTKREKAKKLMEKRQQLRQQNKKDKKAQLDSDYESDDEE